MCCWRKSREYGCLGSKVNAVYNLRKLLCSHESVRLLLLLSLITCIYWPFLLGVNLGAGDAQWYHTVLVDAIEQLHAGVFPVYVGQSISSYFGTEYIRAPYYILFGQFLNLITFSQLNTLHVQHLTVFTSALAGGYFCYFLLTKVNFITSRWSAVFFGIIGNIYVNDSYHSFMSLPFLPLLIYGLIRGYQINDVRASLIVAAALSLLFLCHPPIALIAAAACAFFYAMQCIFTRANKANIALVVPVFLLLSCWQFVSIYSLGLATDYAPNQVDYVAKVVSLLREQIPGVLLPLEWSKSTGLQFLQLGYALWAAVFLGFFVALRRSNQCVMRLLIACIFSLLFFLYPLPMIGDYLWMLMPHFLKAIIFLWPMERFYYVLAPLSCFLGFMAFCAVYQSAKQQQKLILIAILLMLCGWSVYQAYFFQSHYNMNRTEKTWLMPNSVYFFHEYIQPDHQLSLFEGVYDPILKNKLLDSQLNYLPEYDNEKILETRCLNKPIKNLSLQMNYASGEVLHLFKFEILPNKKYLLCLEAAFNPPLKQNLIFGMSRPIHFEVHGDQYQAGLEPILSPYVGSEERDSKQVFSIPLMISAQHGKEIEARFWMNGEGSVKIAYYGLITYDSDSLPIKIQSVFPYRGSTESKSVGNYLEIFKEYMPGYQAMVNGKVALVLRSPTNLLMIPLELGSNDVSLRYTGTEVMAVSFYISVIGWILFILYFSVICHRKYSRRMVVNDRN
jgi:hypothetical protein